MRPPARLPGTAVDHSTTPFGFQVGRRRWWGLALGVLVFLGSLGPRPGVAADAPDVGRTESSLRTWHFAEGNGRHGFQTFFTIFNLSDQPASVTIAYQRDDGIRLTQWVGVQPGARIGFDASNVVGPRAFGASFSADRDVVVERSTTWGPGHNAETTLGFAPVDMRSWYFAEGTTRGKVTTYFLSQNLDDSPATVTATFTRDDGSAQTRTYTLGARMREAYRMDDLMPDTAFSARFLADQDIVVERTLYFSGQSGFTTLGAGASR